MISHHDRHHAGDADVRAQLSSWVSRVPWATASWCELIGGLLAAGRADVPLSRLLEGHVDALRILDQAGREPVASVLYGVWASRSQQTGVAARPTAGDGLVLDGTIRFASGTGVLDRALVPAWLGAGTHVLVDLDVRELPVDTTQWSTAAMEVSRSHTVTVAEVPVGADRVIGPPGFYLGRPGFFPGGVGVAACWAGGAARLADLVQARLSDPVPDSISLRLGSIRLQLAAASAALSTAATLLDADFPRGHAADPTSGSPDWRAVSTEARAVVASAVDTVINETHRISGPAGLAYDVDLSRAAHDLRLYVLQQNADGDALYLGRTSRP